MVDQEHEIVVTGSNSLVIASKGNNGYRVILNLISSNPPQGKKKITNIYWDDVTNEIVVEHEP